MNKQTSLIFEGTFFKEWLRYFFEYLTQNSNHGQYLIVTDQKPKKKWDNSTLNKGRSGNALSNAITAMSSQTGSTLRDQALDQRRSIYIRTVRQKPSLKIRTANATFGADCGILRENGLEYVFFRDKTFFFSR